MIRQIQQALNRGCIRYLLGQFQLANIANSKNDDSRFSYRPRTNTIIHIRNDETWIFNCILIFDCNRAALLNRKMEQVKIESPNRKPKISISWNIKLVKCRVSLRIYSWFWYHYHRFTIRQDIQLSATLRKRVVRSFEFFEFWIWFACMSLLFEIFEIHCMHILWDSALDFVAVPFDNIFTIHKHTQHTDVYLQTNTCLNINNIKL